MSTSNDSMNNQLFTNTPLNNGTTIRVIKGEPGINSKYQIRPVLIYLILLSQRRWSAISVGQLDRSLELNPVATIRIVFRPCGEIQSIRYAWSTQPWFWTLMETCFPSWYRKGYNPLALWTSSTYSISQEKCTRFCCALLCCGYAIVHNEFTWSIYPYSSGLLCWHWGNR